jgi:hypothetical protein
MDRCGSFVAPLLASRVFFAHTANNSQGLKSVQWTSLGVACFVGLLLILFFLAPMLFDTYKAEIKLMVVFRVEPRPCHFAFRVNRGVCPL